MPIPAKFQADFREQDIYHVYNRTNNEEPLFLDNADMISFLNKYDKFLSPFLDTFGWSLLPNHFHLLTRIKPRSLIEINLKAIPFKNLIPTEKKFLNNEIEISELIEQSFKRLFQSYSLGFNFLYERKGNLFHRPFKRIEVCDDSQLTRAMVYIHANAQKHGLVTDFTDWPWSSWHNLLSGPATPLRNEIMNWFGGADLFIKTHKEMIRYYYENDLSIEE